MKYEQPGPEQEPQEPPGFCFQNPMENIPIQCNLALIINPTMYYHDAKSGKCKSTQAFKYGSSCPNHQNKFKTMKECVATCKPEN